jgi:hypothetical protein
MGIHEDDKEKTAFKTVDGLFSLGDWYPLHVWRSPCLF